MLKKLTPFIIFALIGAILGGGVVYGFMGKHAKPTPGINGISNLGAPNIKGPVSEARNTPIVKASQAVGPTVVGITNKAYVRDFFNRKMLVEKGTGSGVIFDAKGYIVTNHHVIAQAQEIIVSLADGRTVPGTVLGSDPATDLAVVKIEANDLPAATFGDSDNILVGEPAIAIGNPLGMEFKGSVTTGVISALNRSIDIGERRFKLIQTDAAINPGNSGGALVNADGMVIGINSAKISVEGVEGIGLAIPINTARPIIEQLIDKGRVIRSYLGVGVLDSNLAMRYGYALPNKKGLLIANLSPNGPASKAGIKEGDIILKVGGTETNTAVELRSILDAKPVGSKVEVELNREGNIRKVDVKLEEMPVE